MRVVLQVFDRVASLPPAKGNLASSREKKRKKMNTSSVEHIFSFPFPLFVFVHSNAKKQVQHIKCKSDQCVEVVFLRMV